jgi:hypothetical protein
MKLTRAEERILIRIHHSLRFRSQARTRCALRDKGLICNDPKTGAYLLTDAGRNEVRRVLVKSVRMVLL